jgi:hypothetical protein
MEGFTGFNFMEAIRKPSPRKQEILSKFFWLRTFLLAADRLERKLNIPPRQLQKVIETVWNAQTAYTQADDDDYNYNVALETYQMLENGLMAVGIDIDAGILAVMELNGYTNLRQMKPALREIPDNFFEIDAPVRVGTKDPWEA